MSTEGSSKYLVAEAQLLAEKARSEKAKQLKTVGDPIELPGKALAIEIEDSHAWIAENTATVKKLNLESGKVAQIYKGHTGPVTSIAFFDNENGRVLISGSWDRSIRLWNTKTKEQISSTPDAHSDFVKALRVIPSLRLLVSGGSDKIVRFWDLSSPTTALLNVGSISSHTRPVECLAGYATSESSAVLYTADTMGIVRIWDLQKESTAEHERPLWRSSLRTELTHHRTRINDLVIGQNLVWTASTDETVQIIPAPEADPKVVVQTKTPKAIEHKTAVKALLPLSLTELGEPYLLAASGDAIHAYDLSTLAEPELLATTDIHWHDVTAIKLWYRKTTNDGVTQAEPWIVTTSLDQTIRKWRLADILDPPPPPPKVEEPDVPVISVSSGLTEEEERELAELLDED